MKFFVSALLLCLSWASVSIAGTVTYIYTDPQGTPLAETDAHGNITARFDYRPYGVQALGNAPSGPGYTGHVNDPDVGLVYMQQRHYDPEMGRFLSVDPIVASPEDLFGFNRYIYGSDNPVAYIDPDGRADCVPGGCKVGPIPPSFYRDTVAGRLISHSVGDTIAVFRSDNVNPLNGRALDARQMQDAKLGILLLAAPAPAKAEAEVANALKPMVRGVASEARVLLEMGLEKNTKSVATSEGRAIPDAMTDEMSLEVKDAANVYATKQVRVQTDSAAATSGQESVLVTGERTRVSGPAAARYDRIIRRKDLGPQQ